MSFDFQAAYDELNPADDDYRFYAALAAAVGVEDDDWEAWTRERTLRTVQTPEGAVEFWHETAAVSLPLVSYDTLTRNLSTGETTASRDALAFRDEGALRASLEHAGFEVRHVYGDWDQTAPAASSPELIVIARAGI